MMKLEGYTYRILVAAEHFLLMTALMTEMSYFFVFVGVAEFVCFAWFVQASSSTSIIPIAASASFLFLLASVCVLLFLLSLVGWLFFASWLVVVDVAVSLLLLVTFSCCHLVVRSSSIL